MLNGERTTLDFNEVLSDFLFSEIIEGYSKLYDERLITIVNRFFGEAADAFNSFADTTGKLSSSFSVT